MEVHHSHHPTHKKKWSEYLLEFFMLFIAVSMGFLAENIREEQVVKHQTINVLTQLHEELKLDTNELNQIAILHERFDTVTSFILYYIDQKNIEKHKRDFYLLNAYNTYRAGLFESNCVALDQLKFAGLLKNVTDDSLRGLIEIYNYSLNSLASRTAREVAFMDKHMDELRLAPFDLYKTYYPNLEFANNIKGTIVKEADVSCLNRTFHLSLISTFVPENLTIKKFDKNNYRNILIELNIIRNSSQERQHSLAKKRAINLLKRLEEVYPEIENEKHT